MCGRLVRHRTDSLWRTCWFRRLAERSPADRILPLAFVHADQASVRPDVFAMARDVSQSTLPHFRVRDRRRSIETIFDHPIFEFPYNQVRIRAFSPGVFVSEFLNQLGDQIEVAGSTISLLFFGLRNHNSPLKALSRIEGRSASNSAAVRLARG